MQNIERRIAALEASARDDTLKVIIMKDGETQADALRRSGCQPDALGLLYCTPLDALL